jgi:hypothetical protein
MKGSQKFPEFFDIDDLCTMSSYHLDSVTGHFYVQVLQRKQRDKWQAVVSASR